MAYQRRLEDHKRIEETELCRRRRLSATYAPGDDEEEDDSEDDRIMETSRFREPV
jgi:hypothetical protein